MDTNEKVYPTTPDGEGWYYASAPDEAALTESKIFGTNGIIKRVNDDIVFPSGQDADGWNYEDAGQLALDIQTRTDADGNVFKRVALKMGRTAIMRELTGKETALAAKLSGKNPDKMISAAIALCTTITDKDGNAVKFVMEDLESWKAKDLNRLQVACQQINF